MSDTATQSSTAATIGVCTAPLTLAFHSVASLEAGDNPHYYVSPQKFARMIGWLRQRGYTCVPVGDGAANAKRTFELTFDDGYDDFYAAVFPHVADWALRPMVFVVAGQIGGTNEWDVSRARPRQLLNLSQMREMLAHGVEFGSHTMTHPRLTIVTDQQLRTELRDSKSRLEDALGVQIGVFAYPYGAADDRVKHAVAEAGYVRAYTTVPGLNDSSADTLRLKRVEVGEADSMYSFAYRVRHGLRCSERMRAMVPNPMRRVARRIRRVLAPWAGQFR